MSSALQNRNISIAEEITLLLGQELKQFISKVYGSITVAESEIQDKIKRWKKHVRAELITIVSELDKFLENEIAPIRSNETTSGITPADDGTEWHETPLGTLFSSTLLEQATEILRSEALSMLRFEIIPRCFQVSSAPTMNVLQHSETQNDLNSSILKWKRLQIKKFKVFVIDMEEDLKKILSSASNDGNENVWSEEENLDLILNSNESFLNTIVAGMKTNDVIENFWKLFIDKFFSSNACVRETGSTTQIVGNGPQPEMSPYVAGYGKWKHEARNRLRAVIFGFAQEFVAIMDNQTETRENARFSSSTLIAIQQFNQLKRDMMEESLKPPKAIESMNEVIGASRSCVKVMKEECLHQCRLYMRKSAVTFTKLLDRAQESVLKNGFTQKDLQAFRKSFKLYDEYDDEINM
ncbi:hypothetical protein NPIL_525421 [Nephila pilipes]|uniref:Uncharacterized protein n=1 Tax=Nephila pilipes TaxID=299642 RepID=A0A8X6TLK3_NEPPI|nr:hypothetical protein NPIL_525421 [Nephila pilipes]